MFNSFIGQKLEAVEKFLKDRGINYIVVNNNFNLSGDTLLVTNVKQQNNQIVLVVGEFIFDLERKLHENWIRFK